MHYRWVLPLLVSLCNATAAVAQTELQAPHLETWGYWQRDVNGATVWKLQPRLFVPFRLGNGWHFSQRIDVPMVYTDDAGAGNPTGGYSAGFGDAFIEEIFESPRMANKFSWLSSLRLVFPTGKEAPFGASQYQLAPGLGARLRAPELLRGVDFAPFARYFWGFDPQVAGVTTVRSLTLFPTTTFTLGGPWSLAFYPENSINYDFRTRKWFVPLDLLFIRQLGPSTSFSLGGAVNLGPQDGASYRYLINLRLDFGF
jgi:hypothetical protein